MDIEKKIERGSYFIDSGCRVWRAAIGKNKYGSIRVNGKVKKAHRVSFEFFNGRKIKSGMLVLHKCDNRACINPDHLYEGNHKQNTKDMYDRGRNRNPARLHGSKNPNAKISETDVILLRKDRAAGMTYKNISQKYGISETVAALIYERRAWRHVHS